jgi:hypothetical protein
MRAQKLISITVPTAPRELDRKTQCKFSNATDAIWSCGELGQSYGIALVSEDYPLNRHKNVLDQFHFEECKRKRILP